MTEEEKREARRKFRPVIQPENEEALDVAQRRRNLIERCDVVNHMIANDARLRSLVTEGVDCTYKDDFAEARNDARAIFGLMAAILDNEEVKA